MLPASFLLRCAPGLGLFMPRLCLGFLPLLAAAAPLAQGLLSGAGGGGNAPAALPPPAAPIEQTTSFGAVSFGAKYVGDSAVKEAPAILSAENKSWTKYLPWIVGGVVALFAILLIPFGARRR